MATVSYWLAGLGLVSICLGAAVENAPQKCPVQSGNLLDVDLFVASEDECLSKCSRLSNCLFYYFYTAPIRSRQPPQCFLYATCDRLVLSATEDCPMGKDNVIAVMAFIEDEESCTATCSNNPLCTYFQYFNSTDEKQPRMCYHLKSCVPKLVKKSECPLEKNNYIDHRLFVQSEGDCKSLCEETTDCRYFYWYTIDYSPAPLYCYLFRSCINGGEEPQSAILTGGRHPGQYFLTGGETMDILMGDKACYTRVMPENFTLETARGAAASAMVIDTILLCGGRDPEGRVLDTCIAYNTSANLWSPHSRLLAPREEAASVVVRDTMFILGGIVDEELTSSVELWNADKEEWQASTDMPEVRARFCAVPVDGRFLAVIGGEMSGQVLNTMKTLDVETGDWKMQAQTLKIARKDHACAPVRLDDEDGIMVSGGVDENNQPLASVEFFSISKQEWRSLADLKIPRTEHGLAVVNGIPTVVGGVAATEFLASVEQLDDSNNVDLPYQREWRISAQTLSVPRYDFSMAVLPNSMVHSDICSLP